MQEARLADPLHLDDHQPAELWAAMAIASASTVSASFSMVTLPLVSAVVPRTMPTWMGKVL